MEEGLWKPTREVFCIGKEVGPIGRKTHLLVIAKFGC